MPNDDLLISVAFVVVFCRVGSLWVTGVMLNQHYVPAGCLLCIYLQQLQNIILKQY